MGCLGLIDLYNYSTPVRVTVDQQTLDGEKVTAGQQVTIHTHQSASVRANADEHRRSKAKWKLI